MNLAQILKDSNYKLSQFTTEEIAQLEQSIILKSSKSGEAPYTVCLVRKKEIKLTPEEAIRQLYLRVLTERFYYPLNRIQVEYGVNFGREVKRADIVIMDKDRPDAVYILVELKKPKLKDGKEQLRSYCNGTGAPIGVWTNGDQIEHYQRKDPNFFEKIPNIPTANQTLADVLQKSFTLDDLKELNTQEKQRSLKEIIEEMEDEVLANAGVDVFEEVFKLIFTKLYDEWMSGRKGQSGKRQLQFFNSGQTETELKTKLQTLFDAAKKKWHGVFQPNEKIALTGSHLSVCVSYLEFCKLFNSNLDIVDQAFEYLINQSSKGEKGQYFTPRYVIDMCVKMLNPKENEFMIDPAAGSSGFPVHTMFHVWQQIYIDEGEEPSDMLTAEEKLPRCEDYVEEKVFAIDFDEKAVRVARTLNLIAGDGQTNVLHLNTLDYKRWHEWMDDDWQGIYGNGFRRLRKLQAQKDDYKAFLFDIVMANPPFAGDIKESLMISSYELTKDKAGKTKGVGRDILFIERNLDFLKPGGRMAVVLPQGRFNNSSDKYIRDFIAERCRILAVVGLHGNTFKPHTGTKTSVLLVQKWNDDPKVGALCPRKDDYNIFFATMQKSGKDNSGEKIYVKKSDGSGEFLLDGHEHWIIDHDLFNHEGKTQDGIAEAFIEFAKKENLSFFKLSPSVAPFDAVKYQRLMDGLEATELSWNEVLNNNIYFRIDSEYYYKRFIEVDKVTRRKRHQKISEFATVTDGEHGSPDLDEDSGIIYLSGQNVKDNFIDLSNIQYCSERLHKKNLRSSVKVGNVLMSIVGTVGKATVVYEEFTGNTDRNVATIKDINSDFSPYFISTFLNSYYGISQTERLSTGNVQPLLNLLQVKSILIPSLEQKFQIEIKNVVKTAHFLKSRSSYFYQQAEDLLLSELNLKDWQPTKETIAIKSFKESFLSSSRLDAEYYQPKYDQAEKAIKNCGFPTQNLGSLIEPIQNGFDYREYTEEGTPYIRVGDVKNGQINIESTVKIPISMADVDKPVGLQIGDILFTRKGSFGNSAVVTELEVNGIISSEIMLVRLTSISKQTILPEYVSLFLNSQFGYLQVERRVHGVAYYSISQPDLANLLIPILPKSQQENIVEKIKSSFLLKLKSKQLLEIAKIGVEKAIETDEAIATDWINQQLEWLGIDLRK